MDKINIGILGAGRQGQIHIKNVAYGIQNARLAALADPFKGNLDKIDLEGIKKYDDCEKIFNDSSIDAVIIASSTNSHEEMILRACKAKKHIFCEKPLALSMDAIDRCLNAVEESGVKFMIGFNRRFDPSFAKMSNMVRDGKIGRPQVISIVSRDPNPPSLEYLKVSGGFFFDTTVHDFDMARYIMHDEIEEVYAKGDALIFEEINELGDFDTTMVLIKFKNGAFGSITNSRRNVYGFEQRVEIMGSEGSLFGQNRTETQVEYKDENGGHTDKYLLFFTERYPEAFLYEIKQFVASIVNNTETPVTGKDAKIAVLLSMAAKKSNEEKMPIKLDYSSII
jgi:myo-inositol 2-dehydrogenase/D-chiro-inositol 1-dehydrogenase